MKNQVFAHNLRILRKRFHLTQKELAKRVGVTWEMISRYENNKTMPDWNTFLRLAKALHVSPAHLLESDLKLADSSAESYSCMKFPLIVLTGGLKSCEDLINMVNKTSAFYLLSGNSFVSDEKKFVLVKDKTLLSLPGILKSLEDFPVYIVLSFITENKGYKEGSLYLALGEKLSIIFGRNITSSDRVCAKVERLIVDFD